MNDIPHLNEFQWENEIRKHESNLADFFQDLVYCLDLPAADLPSSINAKEAETPSDPVAAKNAEALRQWMNDHNDDSDDDSENEAQDEYEPRRAVCFSCVDSLDQLAVIWNQYSTAKCSGKTACYALGITCAFAKLLARVADFTEPSKYCEHTLLITLGKRTLADLSDLIFRLDTCENMQKNGDGIFDFFRLRLALLRDQLIGRLDDLRNQ